MVAENRALQLVLCLCRVLQNEACCKNQLSIADRSAYIAVMNTSDEIELLARCRRGDAGAWDELFDLHYAAVGRFVFQLGSDFTLDDSEEISQETFLAAIRNLKSFDGRSRIQTWLFRIAANKAHDHRGRHRAAKRGGGQTPVSLNAEDSETGLPIDPPSDAPSPDAFLLSSERMEIIRQAVDDLGDSCREVIELRYFADLGYADIATALNLNVKTVSSRLSKCLDRLQTSINHMTKLDKISPFSV